MLRLWASEFSSWIQHLPKVLMYMNIMSYLQKSDKHGCILTIHPTINLSGPAGCSN